MELKRINLEKKRVEREASDPGMEGHQTLWLSVRWPTLALGGALESIGPWGLVASDRPGALFSLGVRERGHVVACERARRSVGL